ncbi:amidohydrolase [Streptomyces orinoci]|uniref:Amidohydrolase n=1 Tax=Streptomyces orinoci TaxID=67339 RepID=A0ABV3K460_STRON|nr:amidohydrolase [Streptomyces orinoci]
MTGLEDALWSYRTGLLPAGDPLVTVLEELAGRRRDHLLPAVGLVDVRTGRVARPCDLEVADGRIVKRGPAAACRWYALPGLVDAHAHVSSAADQAGLLVYGVTGYRQMWGEPAHRYAAGVHRARHAVLPRPWVASGVVDGPGSRVPAAVTVVDGPRAVRHVVNEALAFGFDGIKIYDDLAEPEFTALIGAARRVGLPVVGHVPERVPLAVALREMWSTEHLYGLVPNVFRLPPAARWPALAKALDRRETQLDTLAKQFAGCWVCPTLTAWRARTGERRYTRPSAAALRTAAGGRRRAWGAAAREALGTTEAVARERGELVDRLGRLVRVLAENGARLLVGTDCGNPFVVAGPSFHKELAELSRAGLGLAAILTAATTAAHQALRPDERDPADLVLYRRLPAEVADLARPDAVLVDGVLLDGADLDRLWALRLADAGLEPADWPRGRLDAVVAGAPPKREVTSAS